MGLYIRRLLVPSIFLILIAEIIFSVKAENENDLSASHHQNNYQEGQFEDPRWKRDILKGKNHDFISTRSKRYIGRVPVSYMKKVVPSVDIESYDDIENENGDDTLISPGAYNNHPSAPVASHFREFQMRQGASSGIHPKSSKLTGSVPRSELTLEEPRMLPAMSKTHRNQRRYIPNMDTQQSSYQQSQSNDDEISPLSDDEIQTLLLMLDGYELTGNNRAKNPHVKDVRPPETYYAPGGYLLAPGDLQRVAQMYAAGKKRETGKRSARNYEQPMSFDNALYPGEDRLEFLNEKRSKRIGARNLMAKTTSSNRFKKETDPEVLATLGRVFNTQSNPDEEKASHNSPITKSTSASTGSPTLMINDKPKKSINWANHFGIDKRTNEKPKAPAMEGNIHHNGNDKEMVEIQSEVPAAATSHPSLQSSSSSVSPSDRISHTSSSAVNGKIDKQSAKKLEERLENQTENKEHKDEDEYMLRELFKNFAMHTNVKRESPPAKPNDLEKLDELQKKMADAGDKIISDALRYAGSHKDELMSPEELKKVKNNIIEKLSTAYSLEKVREAVEELRQQISALD